MPVDDLDDAHNDGYLIVMIELEPLLDDVAPDDDGVSLWSNWCIWLTIAMAATMIHDDDSYDD